MAESTEDLKLEGADPNAGEDIQAEDEEEKGTEGTDKPEEEETPEDKVEEVPDGFSPPVRKSPQDFIKERIAKRKEKKEEKEDIDEPDDTPDEDERIDRKVSERLDPILKMNKEQMDDREIRDYLLDNPEHKKFEKLARKYLENPAYDNVPISVIFRHLAFEKSDPKATEKTRKNKMSGSSARRGEDSEVDAFEIPEKDFQAKVQHLRTHRKPRS